LIGPSGSDAALRLRRRAGFSMLVE